MVTPQQIYNEFSSGQRDGTAIKRFMKMLYDRAGADPELLPRYLLLFGDGSYNNVNALPDNRRAVHPGHRIGIRLLRNGHRYRRHLGIF